MVTGLHYAPEYEVGSSTACLLVGATQDAATQVRNMRQYRWCHVETSKNLGLCSKTAQLKSVFQQGPGSDFLFALKFEECWFQIQI